MIAVHDSPPVGVPMGKVIELNSATEAELRTIRGIGPVLAARIVEARSASGAFGAADEVRARVRGVGATKVEVLKAHSTCGKPKPSMNSVSAVELSSACSGIGPKLAAAIIEKRTQLGAFTDVAQLEQVHGVGPKRAAAVVRCFSL